MARRLLLSGSLVFVCSMGLQAQQGTDFSGSWVLEKGTGSSADIPVRLTVEQPITTTTRLGTPMPAAYLTITIRRHFANSIRDDTYNIGVSGGVVGGLPGVPSGSRRSEFSTRWKGNSLWIEQRNFESGEVAREWTELWQLDDAGRLIVTLELRERGKAETRTLAFRKESNK